MSDKTLDALKNLIGAIDHTPLGVRAIVALGEAKKALAAANAEPSRIPEGAAIDANGVTYHNVAEMYYRFEQAECLHMWLDERKVPRADESGEVFSPIGRVMRYAAANAAEAKPEPIRWLMPDGSCTRDQKYGTEYGGIALCALPAQPNAAQVEDAEYAKLYRWLRTRDVSFEGPECQEFISYIPELGHDGSKLDASIRAAIEIGKAKEG
jgi:hypothetical protein